MPGGNAMLSKPDQQGLAELTARLLTDGSGDLDAQAMERWLSERAASMSAQAPDCRLSASRLPGLRVLNPDYFDILRHVLLNPRLAPGRAGKGSQQHEGRNQHAQGQSPFLHVSRITPLLFRTAASHTAK